MDVCAGGGVDRRGLVLSCSSLPLPNPPTTTTSHLYHRKGQYFEDRTSHRFMETLHRAGVKPVWVDRAGRIKQMHATLRRRVQGRSRLVAVLVWMVGVDG